MTTFLDRAFRFWDGSKWWPDDPSTASTPIASSSPYWNDPIASHEVGVAPTVFSTFTDLSVSPGAIHHPDQDGSSASTVTLTSNVYTSPAGTLVTGGTVQFKTNTGVNVGGPVGYTSGVGYRLTMSAGSSPRAPTGDTYYQAFFSGVTDALTASASGVAGVHVQVISPGYRSGQELPAIWARSYQGDGAMRTNRYTEAFYGWQWNSAGPVTAAGDMRSIILFEVPAEVTNCYSVDQVAVQFYNVGGGYASGLTIYLGTHAASGIPGDYNAIPAKNPRLETGSTARYTRFYKVLNTAAFGPKFQQGAKGIMLGPSNVPLDPGTTSQHLAGYAELNNADPFIDSAPAHPEGSYAPRLWIWYRVWA